MSRILITGGSGGLGQQADATFVEGRLYRAYPQPAST